MFDAIARPFGMLLMFFYSIVQNYGVAIFLIALVIKVILLPFQMKSKRGMMRQARLQPKIAELQKKHGTNKQKLNEETMKLYKQEGVSPASGCIWGFLPLPILLAFFQVIRQPITIMMGVAADLLAEGGAIFNKLLDLKIYETAEKLTEVLRGSYGQIEVAQKITEKIDEFGGITDNLSRISFNFLGLDLGITPQWDFLWAGDMNLYGGSWAMGFFLFLIPLISGGMQFFASRLNKKMNPSLMPEGQGKSMNMIMMLMPLFSVYIAFVTPAALGFYWTISTGLQIIQDVWLTKVYTKKINAEEAIKNEERLKKEAELEEKRLETERRKAAGLVDRNPNTAKRKKQKSEKQGQLEKSAEWQKKNAPTEEEEKYEPSRVGKRRYARGRAYDPDRYEALAIGEDEDASEDDDFDDDAENEDTQVIEDTETDDDFDEDFDDDDDDDDEYDDYDDDDDDDDDDEDDDEDDDDEDDDE